METDSPGPPSRSIFVHGILMTEAEMEQEKEGIVSAAVDVAATGIGKATDLVSSAAKRVRKAVTRKRSSTKKSSSASRKSAGRKSSGAKRADERLRGGRPQLARNLKVAGSELVLVEAR